MVNTSSPRVRNAYRKWFADFNSSVKNLMNRYKVHFVEISTEGDYVKDLMGLFR